MIELHVKKSNIEIEMRGTDRIILDELSLAVIRMLEALENSDGNPLNDNLALLILMLLEKSGNNE